MDITQTIALTMGVAWASGINLYAAIVMLGYLGSTGNIDLPPELQILTNPAVMLAAGVLFSVPLRRTLIVEQKLRTFLPPSQRPREEAA